MNVTQLYRYPVKGLKPQLLDTVSLEPGETMPLDRGWAIENGQGRFDPNDPKHLAKTNFVMLMRNEKLAALDIAFDEEENTLTLLRDGKRVVGGSLDSLLGRQLIEQFIAGFMEDDLRGAPHIVHAPGHSFSDVAVKCLHIVNLASIRDLERTLAKPVDPLRFRANIYFESDQPWSEFSWIDKSLTIGGVEFDVIDRTSRCAATNVDPASANRDMAIPETLLRAHGHQDFGIYAVVKKGGDISTGDTVSAPQ